MRDPAYLEQQNGGLEEGDVVGVAGIGLVGLHLRERGLDQAQVGALDTDHAQRQDASAEENKVIL